MAVLLLLLFAGSGLVAVGSMIITLRQYGAAALALRDNLQDCAGLREVQCNIPESRVNSNGMVIYLLQEMSDLYRSTTWHLILRQGQLSSIRA